MAEHSTIEWTDATANYINGCTLVSEGCRNCYAARLAATRLKDHPTRKRLARLNADGVAKFTGEIRLNEPVLDQVLRWRRPRRIFWNAHGDTFHEAVPEEAIDRMFAVMALTPQHVHQVLTKRPERMRAYMHGTRSSIPYLGKMPLERIHLEAAAHMEGDGGLMDALKERGNVYSLYLDAPWPLPNVWLGTSVEDQAAADERIPHLLATPAAVRFVSAEPLLRAIRLDAVQISRLDWVIVGGESGRKARPMHPDWARSLRDQCAAAVVPFFFKQWGEFRPAATVEEATSHPTLVHRDGERCHSGFYHLEHQVRAYLDPTSYAACAMARLGKSAAGRLLDGVEHSEWPEVRHG